MVVIDVLHFLRKEISAEALMRFYPGLLTEEPLHRAGLLAKPTGDEESLEAALLTLFYGHSSMTSAMEAYILSGEYKNFSTGGVIDGENLQHSLHWEDIAPAMTTFRRLPSVVVENDLLSGSNIYISIANGETDSKEYIIRVGNESNSKTLWPLLLANFFKDQSASFPIMAGLDEHNILSMGFDFDHFHFYLNSWRRNDFTLQIEMAAVENSSEPSQPAHYVHFSGGGRKTDTRDDIGLGHTMLLEQEEKLALQVKETLAIRRTAGVGESNGTADVVSSLPSISRVIVTLVENDERFIMLQRKVPENILSDTAEMAFFYCR
ncbi:hypothetical protein ABK905_20880 [Acerihabitans sp. KWT182]|uniref:Uncharacterized protein n=1 Tax=Acerihabitans sp. KWT182 TaxID=3157919 RepID=A0AAU7Q9B1_9GAMM